MDRFSVRGFGCGGECFIPVDAKGLSEPLDAAEVVVAAAIHVGLLA